MLRAQRWPEDPRVELFLPFLTQAMCYKLLTVLPTYLLFFLLSISLCPSTTTTTSTHKHLKGELNLCSSFHRAMCEEQEARGLLIEAFTRCSCLVTPPAHHSADSKHLTQGSSQHTYSRQINFTSLRASVSINLSLFRPLFSIALRAEDERKLCHLAACQNNII